MLMPVSQVFAKTSFEGAKKLTQLNRIEQPNLKTEPVQTVQVAKLAESALS
jgi:hypothetical protein